MSDLQVLKLFKSMVTEPRIGFLDFSNVGRGFITDFSPTPLQLKVLVEEFKPLEMRTLFSVEERKNSSLEQLLSKQILHYIEVYGLGAPGLFNLEFEGGKVIPITYVQGVSIDTLWNKVLTLLYANAPIKDAKGLKEIIDSYHLDFYLNAVKNNELRVMLFSLGKNTFSSGDDAVRYMCYVATDSPLLIKSKEVIKALKAKRDLFKTNFFWAHVIPLAKVFHRHKNLILAAKTTENRNVINLISRRAKDEHVPIHEPLAKRFISEAYKGKIEGDVLSKMTIRDKFKFLNLLRYKEQGYSMDAFIIRNGKVHLEKGREVLKAGKLAVITRMVLDSLREDLAHLGNVNILLDPNVDYGLPISRKQTFGQLPFGTMVTPTGNTISSGIYWENEWGATDLDLSGIDPTGHRVGWGQMSGYTDRDIIFSGDVTDARNGAMEFLTSKTTYRETYAVFVNIWSGDVGAKVAIVVGSQIRSSGRWLEEPVLREVGTLESKGNILGFVRGGKFVVYNCRLNSNCWSVGSKEAAIVKRGLADFWTIRTLFDTLDISYSIRKEVGKDYNHDLSYQGFSLDKLEAMIQNK